MIKSNLNTPTVIMYHYVRPIKGSSFPGIRGLEPNEFKAQVQRLRSLGEILNLKSFFELVKSGADIDGPAFLLTFDDGLIDHINFVAPVLADLKCSAVFFPPASSTFERRLLDVQKLQFSIACAPSELEWIQKSVSSCAARGFTLKFPPKSIKRKQHEDSAEVLIVKKALQRDLPINIRRAICDELFAHYVGIEQDEFANELYLSESDLKSLASQGFDVGGHSFSHPWLSSLEAHEISREIRCARRVLQMPREVTSFAYPYGDFDERVLQCLTQDDWDVAFTVREEDSNCKQRNLLRIPRRDCASL
jgi:peptidoglycan/xylan/chitin deacetylase (PgdA/CDA1 family)